MLRGRAAYPHWLFGPVFAVLLFTTTSCVALTTPEIETEFGDIKAGRYRLDKHHATLLFKVQHMGLAPYVGRFNHFDADLRIGHGRPESIELNVEIETASIDVNYPDFSDELIGPDWFDSADHPRALFRAETVEWTGENKGRVSGELTLLGVTRPLTMEIKFIGATHHVISGVYTLGFSGAATLQRSSFGLDNFIPVVGDEVSIEIHAEFQLQ
jgi:polyisoprenoid-binding protein YceI